MAKKRSCRRDDYEKEQHERAVRIRKMTDAQLCEYIDDLIADACKKPESPAEISESDKAALRKEGLLNFITELKNRNVGLATGLRVAAGTITKLEVIAEEAGLK